MDSENASVKVNRATLIKVSYQWPDIYLPNLVRAILAPFQVQTKSDPTNCVATMTNVVPQGASSSPDLFNMHVTDPRWW